MYLSASFFSNFIVPDSLDIPGVSLPYLSVNTTPNWYSLSDFIDLPAPDNLGFIGDPNVLVSNSLGNSPKSIKNFGIVSWTYSSF